MRPGQQNKRMRGRNRKGPNPMTRSFESNGGDVKIRGTALHIAEKYVQLARDASSSGDRVAAENYLQHAEHYFRILAAAQVQMPQPQQVVRNDEDGDGDGDEDGDGYETNINGSGLPHQARPVQYGSEQPDFNPDDQQPFANGSGNNNGQEQPFEGQPGDNRGGDNRGGENRERGGFRGGRRRRPFRDRQGGERGEGASTDGASSEGASGARASGEGAQGQEATTPTPVAEE